jgi:hypothetical protein
VITLGGKLKAVTLWDNRFKTEPGAIFDHLTWWEDICDKVPAGTKTVLVSTYVMSYLVKMKYSRCCGIHSDMWMRQYELVCNPPFEVICSPGVAKNIVIALVEE